MKAEAATAATGQVQRAACSTGFSRHTRLYIHVIGIGINAVIKAPSPPSEPEVAEERRARRGRESHGSPGTRALENLCALRLRLRRVPPRHSLPLTAYSIT